MDISLFKNKLLKFTEKFVNWFVGINPMGFFKAIKWILFTII